MNAGPNASTLELTRARAFTRLELAATVTALFLLSLVVLPVLANTKPRADRVTCVNNLRLLGRAEHIWATDHEDQMPWWVDESEGGARWSILRNNAWFNYGVMTNELGTPTILACPSDAGTRPARDFSSVAGGFFHPGNKNNSVSYFIGLHSFLTDVRWSSGYAQGVIQKALAGDRNLRPDSYQSCSCGIDYTAVVYGRYSAQWTNSIHGLVGNILMLDGQVAQISNSRVRQAIDAPVDDNAPAHLLMPH
jgi:hypothetical protein